MKILISQNPFYTASASSNRWLTLIEGLNKLDFKIQLLIIGNYQSNLEKEKFKNITQYKGIEFKYLSTKVIETLWQRRFQNYIGKYLQNYSIKLKINKELSGFDGIVWSENDLILWRVINGIKNKSFKLIAEMSEFLDIHQYNKGNVLQRKLGDAKQNYFEQEYIHTLDGFILMTKTLFNHYQKFPLPNTKLLHLPMTVDLDRFNQMFPVLTDFKQPYIAFVGVMNNKKDGVNILIEAFHQIISKYPKLNLYLVGGWNYDTPQHLKRIKELHLEENIKWMGEYPRDLIPSIITNASLLVLPRPDSKQAQGGFPTKLGEYLATGNPVCATTVGELPDYLIDNESVFFAEPGSIDSFAAAMDRALENPENAIRVGQNGKKIAEKSFNKDIQSKILADFFQKL